jgi:recombination protein RecA
MNLDEILKNTKSVLYSGEQLANVCTKTLPTGVFVFDWLSGGGIPVGDFVNFYGPKGAGKSTFALRVCNQFLKTFPDKIVIWLDFEQSYNHSWACRFISPEYENRFILRIPSYAEEGIDFASRVAKAEDVGLIVVDSLAMMIPTVEADSDAYQSFMGIQSKTINRLFRVLLPSRGRRFESDNPLTVIFTNQIRAFIGGRTHGPMYIKPGGHMQDHVVSLDVRFSAGEYHKSGKEVTHVTQRFSIEKSRQGVPKKAGEFNVLLAPKDHLDVGDVDQVGVIVTYARRSNVITRSGKKYFYHESVFNSILELESYFKDSSRLKNLEQETLVALNSSLVVDDSEVTEDASQMCDVSFLV